MLTSGQMGLDFKNQYIRRNINEKDMAPADKSPPENSLEDPPHGDISPPDPAQDAFKLVQHDLKLNQSAMVPNKEDNANQKLTDLANKSDSVLLKVSTVFPFTFFTHDLIIDPYKVTIVFREFFWSEQVHSILIKDILDIVMESSIFFATIKIVDQGYVENTVDVAYLKKSDALQVRKIVQGLVIAHRQAVDLSAMKSSDIKAKSEELGKVKGFDAES